MITGQAKEVSLICLGELGCQRAEDWLISETNDQYDWIRRKRRRSQEIAATRSGRFLREGEIALQRRECDNPLLRALSPSSPSPAS